MTGLISRIDALCDDSLPALLSCEREHLVAVAFDRLGDSNLTVYRLADLLEESRAPLLPGITQKHFVIRGKYVEKNESSGTRASVTRDHVRFLHVHPTLKLLESPSLAVDEGNHLSIEHEGFLLLRRECRKRID